MSIGGKSHRFILEGKKQIKSTIVRTGICFTSQYMWMPRREFPNSPFPVLPKSHLFVSLCARLCQRECLRLGAEYEMQGLCGELSEVVSSTYRTRHCFLTTKLTTVRWPAASYTRRIGMFEASQSGNQYSFISPKQNSFPSCKEMENK